MPTIQDVARAAAVSPMTVSRVFRGASYVRPETRQRVLDAAAQLNYVPNAVARSLRQSRSGLLAFIITDMKNPLFYDMARGAEDAAHEANMAIVLGNSDDDPVVEAGYLRLMAEHRVDGILLVPTPTTASTSMPHLPARVDLVLLDRRPQGVDASLVSCDTGPATRDLCHHLFGLGRSRVALVGGMPEVQTWHDRLKGYADAHAESGRVVDEGLIIPGDYRAEGGRHAVRQLMASPSRPDAIIAASTQVLDGVLEELGAQDVRIPADIAVSCVDDPDFPAFFRPRFTFVEQPGYEMGAEAVRLLMAGMDEDNRHQVDRVFPARLRIGESCGELLAKPQDAVLTT